MHLRHSGLELKIDTLAETTRVWLLGHEGSLRGLRDSNSGKSPKLGFGTENCGFHRR